LADARVKDKEKINCGRDRKKVYYELSDGLEIMAKRIDSNNS
jgi:hypothetical protein